MQDRDVVFSLSITNRMDKLQSGSIELLTPIVVDNSSRLLKLHHFLDAAFGDISQITFNPQQHWTPRHLQLAVIFLHYAAE